MFGSRGVRAVGTVVGAEVVVGREDEEDMAMWNSPM